MCPLCERDGRLAGGSRDTIPISLSCRSWAVSLSSFPQPSLASVHNMCSVIKLTAELTLSTCMLTERGMHVKLSAHRKNTGEMVTESKCQRESPLEQEE